MFQDENYGAVEEKEFVDETLVCKDCGNEFVFTAGEQRFYAEKGLLQKQCGKVKKTERIQESK